MQSTHTTPESETSVSGAGSGGAAGPSGINRHLATDHADTTPGAIHKYYDENGFS